MLISAKSVEGCISMKRVNTDLQSILVNINNFAAGQTGLFSLIPEAATHMNFAENFVGFFRTPFLHNIW